jgi:hypothetical protein
MILFEWAYTWPVPMVPALSAAMTMPSLIFTETLMVTAANPWMIAR